MNTPTHPTALNASEDLASYPLDELDISLPRRFQDNSFWGFFERMRREDPVHLLQRLDLRPLLVDHQIQRHHGG